MKQYKIINAYNATETLIDNDKLSIEDQWNLYKLRKSLRQYKEFYEERIEAIRQKYVSKVVDDKLIGQDAVDFQNDIFDLDNMEIELDNIEQIKLKLQEGITVHIIESLEDFVEFTM